MMVMRAFLLCQLLLTAQATILRKYGQAYAEEVDVRDPLEVVQLSGNFQRAFRVESPAQKLNRTNDVTKITADVLIPGRGEPLSPGVVLFRNNQILYAGAPNKAPDVGPISKHFDVPVVMPGMWDCHTHFRGIGTHGMKLVRDFYPEKYIRFASAIKQAKDALYAGVTSVRELGGAFSQPLRWLIDRGEIEGPNFHYAARYIGMTGGHTDVQVLPREIVTGDLWESPGALCDGVPECLRRVRENLRLQADVIKVMVSGGVLSEYDSPTEDQFSVEEISAMVQEAARGKRVVAAHAHSHGGIQNAIDSGVYSIEHGSYMSREQAREIKGKGMIYIPTCTVTQVFNSTDKPEEMSDRSWMKGQSVLHVHRIAVENALAEEVTIVAGTDCPHGCAQLGLEVVYLATLYGMQTLEAIEAATANGPLCMGDLGMAPMSGQLKEGYEADLIALSSNPLKDINVIANPDTITHVWKGGKLYKSPSSSGAGASFGPFQ